MRLFDIFGQPLFAEGLGPGLRDWLENYWHFPYGPLPGLTAPIHLIPLAEPVHPSKAPQTLDVFGCRLRRYRHPKGDLLLHGEAALRLELAGEATTLAFTGSSGELAPLLHLGLAEALRLRGLVPLHAAAAERKGLTTAFVGPSGSGKTTTLLRALQAGWSLLAEDFAWLEPTTLTLYGWDKALRMLPDTFARFQSFLGVRAVPFILGKYTVSYEVFPTFTRKPARLTRMLWLKAPQPLGRLDLVKGLWEACGVPLSGRNRSALSKTIAMLIRGVEHRRLLLTSASSGLELAPG